MSALDRAPDATDANPLSPLSTEAEQLLDLMMRAIGVSRSALRQCVVSIDDPADTGAGRPATESDDGSANVANADIKSLLTAGPRAVLLLDPTEQGAASEISQQRCVLPHSSVALWRVPHPQLMLHTPALKRQAWESLKGLQNELNG